VTQDSRYLLVTPCRDEAQYARRTLESVTNQTVTPAKWVIVDDGSTDETPAILAEYAARFPWIEIVTRENRGMRSVGPGVIEAFYFGWDKIDPDEFDFVCKFDLDLDLPPSYFELLITSMHANPRIGTCSGKPYFDAGDGKLVSEACGDEMSVGMTKFYRTECFREIGGFVREVMWDGIDCHRCRMLGWIACSWDDPQLRFTHLRPMGSSQKSMWVGRQRHGFGQWFMGTGFVYMFASAVFRMTRPPYFVGGFGMLWGYARSFLSGARRYDDPEFRTFIRRYQADCLRNGKERATEDCNERQATTWSNRREEARRAHRVSA